jgi:hypothetical protein
MDKNSGDVKICGPPPADVCRILTVQDTVDQNAPPSLSLHAGLKVDTAAALLRSFGNLVLQVPGLMITPQLAQRCLVQIE